MKAIYYSLILLLACPAIVMANPTGDNCKSWSGKYTKEKTINKDYNVSANATLKITNDYGNLELTTWDENRILIEVIIKTNGNDEEKTQKKLDGITVNFDASNNLVIAKTQFGDKGKSKSWWSSWSSDNDNKVNMEINYIVKLPATNNVDLDNDYGGISLDMLKGNAKINCDYGKVTIGDLLSDTNYLSFDYSSGCTFDYIKSAEINADYSGFTIENIENLNLNSDYTSGVILEAKNIEYNSDYGSLDVKQINNITGDGDYYSVKLGDVTGATKIVSDYGNIKINTLMPNAGNVDIDGDYTGIKIGFDAGYSFNFDVSLSYAGFYGKEDLSITTEDKSSYSKKYKGYNGSQSATNLVRINSDYGSVKLIKR